MSDPTSFRNGSYREASINNNGDVAAFAHNSGRGQLIFASNGSTGSIIVGNNRNPSGPQGDFVSVGTSSINDSGKVAFMADRAVGTNGIFLGRDAVADKVIGIGDDFRGSTIVDLAIDRESLSNDNEIAFWAKLADGRQGIYRANSFADSQFNPLLPNCDSDNDGVFAFCDVLPGVWYDPPSAFGFRYTMTGDSLFTKILDLPVGFENPFTVSVGDRVLGDFTAGDSIDFVDLLGAGVKEFSVTGLNVDPDDPQAFPIKLDFDTPTASFEMFALLNEDEHSEVPEPGSVLGLLFFSAFGIKLLRKSSKTK